MTDLEPPTRSEPDGGWDRAAVVTALQHAAERQRDAEVDQVALIAAAADLYSWVDNLENLLSGHPKVQHGERMWRFGADGSPDVAEFITFEIGPALGISPGSAGVLIGDVLDLRHRLRLTWNQVLAGQVRVWIARKIAFMTRVAGLSHELAAELDRQIAPYLAGWTPRRTFRQVTSLIERLDPIAAEERRRKALEARYAHIRQDGDGTAVVQGRIDGPAGAALEGTISHLVKALRESGHTGETEELRAQALEMLADPAYAALLLSASTEANSATDTDTEGNSDTDSPGDPSNGAPVDPNDNTGGGPNTGRGPNPTGGPSPGRGPSTGGADATPDLSGAGSRRISGMGDRGPEPATPFGSPWQVGTLNVDLHLNLTDLVRGAGGATDQLGDIPLSLIAELISRAGKFVIHPILDLNEDWAVDGYQIPEKMRRVVNLRNPCVTVPYSDRPSAGPGIDQDHIVEHPEGETSTSNLTPLDRRGHRIKTFGGHTHTRVRTAVTQWTTPLGQTFYVTPHGTYRHDPATTPTFRPVDPIERASEALNRATKQPDPAREIVRGRIPSESLHPELPDPPSAPPEPPPF